MLAMTQIFNTFSRGLIDQIKAFLTCNEEKVVVKQTILSAIRTLTNEHDCDDTKLIESAFDKIDEPYIGNALIALIDENEKLEKESAISLSEIELLRKIVFVLGNPDYYQPHLDIDLDSLFDPKVKSIELPIEEWDVRSYDTTTTEVAPPDHTMTESEMKHAYDMRNSQINTEDVEPVEKPKMTNEELKKTYCLSDELVEILNERDEKLCPAAEDTTQVEETIEEESTDTVTEEETEEPVVNESQEQKDIADYARMLPLGFIKFDASVFNLEGEYGFRKDGLLLDLNTNNTIQAGRRNGEFVFFVERQTIPLRLIAAVAYGIGCEDETPEQSTVVETAIPDIVEETSEETVEETHTDETSADVCKYIDWIDGIPKTKYRISKRGVFNTISERWVKPQINNNGRDYYVLSSTDGKPGERSSRTNKMRKISVKKLFTQAGF
jgi:hypothetical protein